MDIPPTFSLGLQLPVISSRHLGKLLNVQHWRIKKELCPYSLEPVDRDDGYQDYWITEPVSMLLVIRFSTGAQRDLAMYWEKYRQHSQQQSA